MAGDAPPIPIQVVDIRHLQEMLRQTSNKVTLEVEYNNGEPRLTCIFPHTNTQQETMTMMLMFEKMTTNLVTQAYEHMGVWKKQDKEAGQCKHDPNIA